MSDGRGQASRIALSVPAAFFRGPEAAAAVCPFLGSLDGAGGPGDPVPSYDKRNRCTAYGPALPLGRLQQELVCLTVAHRSCPRYVRGVRFGPAGPKRRPALRSGVSGAIVIGLSALLVLGSGLAFGPLAAFIGSAPESPSPGPTASPTPRATIEPTPTPSVGATATSSPEETPAPTPTSAPILPTPPPGSAYATLAPCPEGELCYLYTVRSGDTLWAISRRFATTIGAIRALNPAVANTDVIHPGQTLKIPPP